MNHYKLQWIRMKATSLMLLMLFCCSATMMAGVKVEELPATAGSELKNGVIYKVSKNTDINNSKGAGLVVAENAVATIYIPENICLTVKGANANGTQGAYAAIVVPRSSTLIITGAGTLQAIGGKVASGGNGGNGGNASVNVELFGGSGTAGSGGAGGYGGGGGAAAIGGNGGNGANATEKVEGPKRDTNTSSFNCKGTSGYNAKNGSYGSAMGKVYVLGSVNVSATYDNTAPVASKAGTNGKTGSGSKWNSYYAGAGGAGGGGGSGFFPQYGIGGGGYGGQSGASGGSGGTLCNESAYRNGGSGEGGYGATKGARATNNYTNNGGAGGSAALLITTYGEAGTLYASTLAHIHTTNNRAVSEYVEGHEAIRTTITFNANKDGAKLGTKTLEVYFGVVPKNIDIPVKEGEFFAGYYTQKEGGELIFDEKGNACHEVRDLSITNLYAHWSTTHIKTVDDLKRLKSDAANGATNGAVYYLEADLDISMCPDLMIGTEKNPFKGTFDGQGYKITLGCESDSGYVGLFSWVEKATIRNLIVDGGVKTKDKFAGSFVGCAINGVTIDNCISYASMYVDVAGDATSGGFIGLVKGDGSYFEINNSAFLGGFFALMNGRTTSCAGMVGWTYGNGSINNSYVGNVNTSTSYYISSKGSHVLVRFSTAKVSAFIDGLPVSVDKYTIKVRNTFYHEELKNQGWATDRIDNLQSYSDDNAKSGELCYKLNGGKPNGAWFQTIGTDEKPSHNTNSMKVFADYSSQKQKMVCHNRNYLQLSTDDAFNIGYTPIKGSQINMLYEAKEKEYTNTGLTVVPEKNIVLSYLYDNGNVMVDTLSAGALGTYAYNIGNSPLYLRCDGKLYEMSILENGIIVHHYIPAFYNKKNGLFDTVERNFIEVPGATAFIDNTLSCQHQYNKQERSYGKYGAHCCICDAMHDFSYYVQAQFSGEDATGVMGEQTLEPGQRLSSNRYYNKLHIFSGWKAYDRNGNNIGKELYADGEALDINENFCDTITFKAQWADAFTVNGDTLLITSDNTKNIQIVDNSRNGFGAAKGFKADRISYTRTIPANYRWGSLCLPFAISENDTTRLYNVGRITTENGEEKIALTRAGKVEAGKPCIFYDARNDIRKERALTFEATDADVVVEPQNLKTAQPLQFTGTFESEAFKCDTLSYSYYGVVKDVFYNVGTSYVVYPYHMYMSMPNESASPAKQLYYIDIDDHATLVKMLNNADSDTDNSTIYDITGTKLTRISTPGVYIVNGKKIHIK